LLAQTAQLVLVLAVGVLARIIGSDHPCHPNLPVM
jgi:hypothetical protein